MNKSTNKVILNVDVSDRTISLHTNFRLTPEIKLQLERNAVGVVFCNTTLYTINVCYGKCFEQNTVLQSVYKVLLALLKGDTFDVVSEDGSVIATYGNRESGGERVTYERSEESTMSVELIHDGVTVSAEDFKSLLKGAVKCRDGGIIKIGDVRAYSDDRRNVLYLYIVDKSNELESTSPDDNCDKYSVEVGDMVWFTTTEPHCYGIGYVVSMTPKGHIYVNVDGRQFPVIAKTVKKLNR